MSNYKAITGSSKIVHRNQGGGSKKQGIPSSTNLSMWSHVAFRNRNVVCPCHRHHVFCMNQLGGIGAGGVPGNSYMFAPRADGINKNKILCNIDHKNIKHPSHFELIYSEPVGGTNNPLQILFTRWNNKYVIDNWNSINYNGNGNYTFITTCYNSGAGEGKDTNCYNKEVVGYTYAIIFKYNRKTYNVSFLITHYKDKHGYLYIKFLSNPSKDLLKILLNYNAIIIIKAYKSTYKINV